MLTMRIFTYLSVILCGVIVSSACSCSSSRKQTVKMDSPDLPYVNTARNARLKLERGLKRYQYIAGQADQEMDFKLMNNNLDRIVNIDEWYGRDEENIKIFMAPCEKGESDKVSEKDWVMVHPYVKPGDKMPSKNRRSPVTLEPGNAILVKADMKFLEDLNMEGKSSKHYAVKAKLDLLTVAAETDVFEIEVVPPVRVLK